MFCINPITLEDKGTFPCGMCRFCRMMRANTWATRMMHEVKYHAKSVFITLTYNDNWLPRDLNLDKPELQRFVKRIRKEVEPLKIKYFACGEYGEKFGRPHYHLIMFGIGVGDRKIIESKWPYGFIYLENVNRKTCRYVAKYVTKAPLGRSRRDKANLTRIPEFQIQSKGIGLSWLMANAETVGERGLSFHGRQINLPRYYYDKLRDAGLCYQVVADAAAERVQESHERREAWRVEGLTEEDIGRRRRDIVLQRIEELRTQNEQHAGKDRDNQ